MAFEWDEELNTYVIKNDEGDDDEILPLAALVQVRDRFALDQQLAARDLADLLVNDEIDLQEFILDMQALIRDTYLGQYLFGRGGLDNMTPEDFARLEALIIEQFGFLQGFGIKIANGEKTAGEIRANAALFLASSVQAFERARAEGVFGLRLPAYPGDGSSICMANDKCFWDIVEEADRWLATWVRTVADSCDTCVERGRLWNPLIVEKV